MDGLLASPVLVDSKWKEFQTQSSDQGETGKKRPLFEKVLTVTGRYEVT